MKKRLLAVLLACCMAVSMASAVFADDVPALTEPPAVTEPADPGPPAADEPVAEEEAPAPAVDEPAPADPTPEPVPEPEPTAAPEPTPDPTAEPTPEPTAEPTETPAESTPEPTEAPAEATPEPTAEPTAAPEPTPTAEPTPAPTETPTPTPAPTETPAPATPETAAAKPVFYDALPEPTLAPVTVETVVLTESIKTDGCFTAVVNGSADKQEGVTYTWYRSKDGTNWEAVTPRKCSGDGWNIAPGSEHKLNAALDACTQTLGETDRLYYKVDVTGGNTVTSAAAQVPYYIQLQNGGFETPAVKNLGTNDGASSRLCYIPDNTNPGRRTYFAQMPDTTAGLVWKTTGSAPHWGTKVKGNYIELVDGTTRSYGRYRNNPAVAYNTTGPNSGEQFAELNCEAYGALYQDVLTAPGATLNWSLAHRGRNGTDSMALLIAPVAVADAITTKLSGYASGNVAAALDETVEVNGETHTIREYIVSENGGNAAITDGNTAWGTHSGTYTVPAGQYVSRFFFLAVSTETGNKCEGNLLDDVWFSTRPAPPVAGRANLTVHKTLLGVPDEQLDAARQGLTFTVTRSDGEEVEKIRGADMTVNTADPAQCSYTLTDLPVENADGTVQYSYTVTETAHAAPAGMYWQSGRAGVNGDLQPAGDMPTLTAITPPRGGTVTADFENTYAAYRSITITKRVTGGMGDARRGFAFTITVDGVPVTSATENVTAAGGAALTETGVTIPHRGSVTIGGLRAGQTFTVTETAAADYETSIDDGNTVTVGTSYTGTVGGADAALTVINNKDGAPPTGLAQSAAPAVWLLAAAAVCAAVTRRRRERRP